MFSIHPSHDIPFEVEAFAGKDALFESVRRDVETGWQVRIHQARCRQARIKAASDRIERRTIEGVGRQQLLIDPDSYHYWGMRLGYDCWDDDEFKRDYARDNETARVKYATGGATNRVGWTAAENYVNRKAAPVKAKAKPGLVLTDRRGQTA